MPVVFVVQGPSFTQAKYEEGARRATGRKLPEAPSDWPVEGLLVHAAGQGAQGFRVVDVFESQEACDQFVQIVGPIFQELGVDVTPEVYAAHNFVSA